MAIFGKRNIQSNAVGKPIVSNTKLEGYPILSVPSTAFGNAPQQIILPQIPNQKGLPIDNLLFQVETILSNSGSSAVSTTPMENAIYEFQLKSRTGDILVDLKGTQFDFTNWQHLKNNNGLYVSSPTTSLGAGASNVNTSWIFNIAYGIQASDFPLTPILTINSLTGATGTATSGSFSMNVLADFKPVAFARSKLVSKAIPTTTTGVYDYTTYLPKGISVKQIAFNFGADGNLNSTSTFNFALGTDYLLQNTSYLKLINKEQNAFPISTPHISGLFPLFIPKYYEDDNTKFNANLSAVPSINGVANTSVAYIEQYI
jgi:hypothetical protein